MRRLTFVCAAVLSIFSANVGAQTPSAPPAGELKGTAWKHNKVSLAASVQQADVCLPAAVAGGSVFCGKYKDLPNTSGGSVPVVVFLHGSSGLGLKAIGEWQQWLAKLGYASIAPDSFALPDHVTYKSPIDKDSYEKIHALRGSEIKPTLLALKDKPWANQSQLILAGTSEGAVSVARYKGSEFSARMLYSWTCESNYFVKEPLNAFESGKPVLNVVSTTDPYFSKANSWLGNAEAQGHCGATLKDAAQHAIVLIPNAPHTLFNLPAARSATAGFLQSVTKP